MTTISATLRDCLRSAPSVNSVAKSTGIPQPMLSRFLSGATLGIGHVDTLAKHFRLVLKRAR